MRNPFLHAVRMQESEWSTASPFKGANSTRLLYDWAVGANHPDSETAFALRPLRARARDLVRNNPYATGVVDAVTDNVIGWEGMRLKPTIADAAGRLVREWNDQVFYAFEEWAERFAFVDEQTDWIEGQRLITGTWATDGEVFVRERRGWKNRFGYALELIDADLLDETYEVGPDENGVEIRQGIELDRHGRHLAYWFWQEHPSRRFGGRKRERIQADRVIPFYQRRRVGQNRGYSLFAPALTTVKMIDGISEAELVATRLAAAKMGFIENKTPEAIEAYAARLRMLNDQGDEAAARVMDIAPGLLEELLPGQEFRGFDPTHPNSSLDVFVKLMLRGVARAFGVSYLTLTGDLEGANYSSMRAGLLPERDHWRAIQFWTMRRLHRRVYRSWLSQALLTGAVRLPSLVSADVSTHQWKPRGWDWVDPEKDLRALARGVAMGVNSRTEGAAARGRDFELVVDEIRDEEAYALEAGVDVSLPKEARAPEDPEPSPGRNGRNTTNRITEVVRNGR